MPRKPKRSEEFLTRSSKPSDRPLPKRRGKRTKSFYTLEIKADDGQILTASSNLGKVLVYLPGGTARKASKTEQKRYFAALKKKEKELDKI